MSVRLIHAHGNPRTSIPFSMGNLVVSNHTPAARRAKIWLVGLPRNSARATPNLYSVHSQLQATGTTPRIATQRLRVHDNSRAPNARSPRGKVTCSSSSSASQCPAPKLPRTEVKLMSVEPVQTPRRGGCPVLPLLSDRPTNRWRASAEFLEGMDECIAGERQTTTVVVQPPSSSTSRGPLKRDSRVSNARKRQHR